jgi:alanyl-tRNA synthetase
MGVLMKETMRNLNGRGGGTKDMAQGGVPQADGIDAALKSVAATLDA